MTLVWVVVGWRRMGRESRQSSPERGAKGATPGRSYLPARGTRRGAGRSKTRFPCLRSVSGPPLHGLLLGVQGYSTEYTISNSLLQVKRHNPALGSEARLPSFLVPDGELAAPAAVYA